MHSARLKQYVKEGAPAPGNQLASGNSLEPAAMRRVHNQFMPRLLILINSCLAPDTSPLAAAKNKRNPASRASRRQAQRETWLAHLPDNVKYYYVVGNSEIAPPEQDLLIAPYADTLRQLGERSAWALRWVLEHETFDYLIRSDDDDYIALAELQKLLATGSMSSFSICGMRNKERAHPDKLAGVCQVIPRAVAQAIAADPAYPAPTHADDLCEAALRVGARLLHPPALQAQPRALSLTGGRLSSYHHTPQTMHLIHAAIKS